MDQLKVIKRDGSIVDFDATKIEKAILKAMKYGSGIIKKDIAKEIAYSIEEIFIEDELPPTVYQIEDTIYYALLESEEELTAKAYEGYKAVQAFKRESNTTDDSIMGLINRVNEEVMNENSNKNGKILPTQRDLVAGEISKDIARRKLIPAHIVQAHDEGVLHYHDMDYAMQAMFNCCLVNIKEMLDNGTVINGKMIESPQSFQTACTILTQIIAQIASAQYGGQSVNIKHLGEYLARSEAKYANMLKDIISDDVEFEKAVNKLLMKELSSGVQTIQYQINTLFSTNGQSPFVTIFLEIDKESDPYYKYTAMIIEEILNQRLQGIKNEKGVYITPAFPKLVYVLDEHNCLKGGEYDDITKLAARCTAKRLYPDYISAKRMREIYEGNVFSPMGQIAAHVKPCELLYA